ncbi:MAG: hypothetical protein EZS28_037010 [Streblomastix strix]|uniref:Uncharacterized protein n=1 Tax=Streblomastix strix TaxID=222440 RepID=A0A5J4UBB1_9EUKA|nr:MAG: hypothetical protein EZS28_037010 [Streblomastix strix]
MIILEVGVFYPVTATIPVGLVIWIGILKDGIEDLIRYKANRIVNRKADHTFRRKEFEQIETCQIRVGDNTTSLSATPGMGGCRSASESQIEQK